MVDAHPHPPKRRTCGAMIMHNLLLERHPEFRLALANLEAATTARLAAAAPEVFKPVTISVVAHVVYAAVADNISDQQIASQIDVLNCDYAAKNSDATKVPAVWKGLVTDPLIQFALAKRDPNGTPTNGVTRTKTTKKSFPADDSVKFAQQGGADAWPADKYLNLWVCALGGGLLGYAQFPGGPVESDGVVILNTAFGTLGTAADPFNKGRTATHEVGHWLNLRHIWGDTEDCSGSDFVDDTPNQQHPNYGKPAFPHVSCHNGPSGDMFMNYMDYVDDELDGHVYAGSGRANARNAAGSQSPAGRKQRIPKKLTAMPQVDPSSLMQKWTHSHEEDTETTMVFRPEGYQFPPSRGRKAFELKSGGDANFQDVGPVDRPLTRSGSWKLEGDKLELDDPSRPGSNIRYEIESVSKDKLVVKK